MESSIAMAWSESSSRCITRGNCKKDLIHNGNTGKIEIDPDTFLVRLDGDQLPVDAAKTLAMTQRYFLF